jgi:hypothetical protein
MAMATGCSHFPGGRDEKRKTKENKSKGEERRGEEIRTSVRSRKRQLFLSLFPFFWARGWLSIYLSLSL